MFETQLPRLSAHMPSVSPCMSSSNPLPSAPRSISQFLCPSGKMCTPFNTFCQDGVSLCMDGSDTEPSFCQSYECATGFAKCRDGVTCVYEGSFCNGRPDCPGETVALEAGVPPGTLQPVFSLAIVLVTSQIVVLSQLCCKAFASC